jgi:hypothetical protein
MKKIFVALAVAALMFGLDEGCDPGAASAVPSCGSGYICFYDATDGSTLLAKVLAASYVRSFCYTASSGKIPAGTSYIVNNPDASSFVVSTATNCGPTTAPVYANSYGPMNSTFSNHIKSIFRA